MALIKQGGCLRGYWPLLARKSVIFLLVVSLSSLALPAQAKNHFIVLFDGSGSMKRNREGAINPFWRGDVDSYENMAQVMSSFINKIVINVEENETLRSRGFKNFDTGEDIFSFLIFVADWNNPNFAPEELFYTNTVLLARSGSLPAFEFYRFFGIRPGRAADGGYGWLNNVFSGHSPIIAATNLSMPFIANKIHERGYESDLDKVVDNIFIIRISDGQYNSSSNGSDEHNVVQRNADNNASGTPGITEDAREGFERYKNISGRVTRAFDIGVREAQCAFSTPNQNYDLDQLLNCNDDAYDNVRDWGTGLLINYLKVEPKAPGVSVLARTDATQVKLQMVYRREDSDQAKPAGVRLTGENAIWMDSSSDNESRFKILPRKNMALESRFKGDTWSACSLEGRSGLCNKGNAGPEFDFSPATLPEFVRYRASYVLKFDRQSGLLYPYRIALKPFEWEVSLARAEVTSNDRIHMLPRDPSDPTFLRFLDPRRLFSDTTLQTKERPIDAEILEDKAKKWQFDIQLLMKDFGVEDSSLIYPWMLARISEEKKSELIRQELSMDSKARLIYPGILVASLILWGSFPRRKLYAQFKPFSLKDSTDSMIRVLDFNDRDHEEVFVFGFVNIENKESNPFPFRQAGFKDIKVSLSPLNEGGDRLQNLKLNKRQSAPFAIGLPDENLYKEKKILAQKIPVYFNPSEIIDLEPSLAASDKAKLDLPVRIVITTRHGLSEDLSTNLPLQVLPEHGELEITRIDMAEQLTDVEAVGVQVREVIYESGKKVKICQYRLSHRAHHRHSYRVTGELEVEPLSYMRDAENQGEPIVLSDGQDNKRLIHFDLGYGETKEFTVLADCDKLNHPHDYDDYDVKVNARYTGNPKSAVKKVGLKEEWILRLKRSEKRTDVSMQVVYSDQNRSQFLNIESKTLNDSFEVGSKERPVDVPILPPKNPQNVKTLFRIRLVNSCRSGIGNAQWKLGIKVEKKCGVDIDDNQVILFSDGHKRIKPEGTLKDSPACEEREKELSIQLNFNEVKLSPERDFQITFMTSVKWQVYKDGQGGGSSPDDEFTTCMRVVCYLRRKPPHHVLAIDFGTSALAIAYANSPKNGKPLPLSELLSEQLQEEGKLNEYNPRYDDKSSEAASMYLCSAVNVNIQGELEKMLPSSENFLQLPLNEAVLYDYPGLCFSSLKPLISAGCTKLPLFLENRRYLDPNKNNQPSDDRSKPLLGDVLTGVYKGLLTRFIKPFLKDENQGYSHVSVTHPNTYSKNHVKFLSDVVKGVFENISHVDTENRVYPENIDFMSESDAVAYYYLMHPELRDGGGVQPSESERERILVYDIGAGTLDLTYLEIEWKEDGIPKDTSPGVLRRAGVVRAGDLLDECIARDLHQLLNKELSKEQGGKEQGGPLYITPIVVDGDTPMPQMDERGEILLMDGLKKGIQAIKRDLSNDDESAILDLDSLGVGSSAKLVLSKVEDTPDLYKSCASFEGVESGKVLWKTTLNEIEKGEFVKAFLENVTCTQLQLFFENEIPIIDTLIISGRTSLWPGFKDKVISTLKKRPKNIIDFGRDPDALKRAVVMGALEKKYLLPSFRFKEPKSVGTFGVRYETLGADGLRHGKFHSHESMGQFQEHNLAHATEVKIGLQTTNSFQCCFAFLPNDYCPNDKPRKLQIKLSLNDKDCLVATIKKANGELETWEDPTAPATLEYRERPWPLSNERLKKISAEELFATE